MEHGRSWSWIMDSDFVCKMVDRIIRIQTYMFTAFYMFTVFFLRTAYEPDGAGSCAADRLCSYLLLRRGEKPGAVAEKPGCCRAMLELLRKGIQPWNLSSLLFDAANFRRTSLAAGAVVLPQI